jgi:hypothetical protein
MPREVTKAGATVSIHCAHRVSELATARARDAGAATAREVIGAGGARVKAAAVARRVANPAAAIGVSGAAGPSPEAAGARRRVARQRTALVVLRARRARREARAVVCGGVAEPVAAVPARAAGAALEAATGPLAETQAVERIEVTGAAAGRAIAPTGAARAAAPRRSGAGTVGARIDAGFVRPTRAVAVTGARVGRRGYGRRARGGRRDGGGRRRAACRAAGIAAARVAPDARRAARRSLAVRGIALDLAVRAVRPRHTARHRARRLPAGRVCGASLNGSRAALVDEGEVRLLDRAAHVRAVARRASAVAVRGDRSPRVGDVRLVGVGSRVAHGVTRSAAHDDAEEDRHRCGNERAGLRRDHGGPLSPVPGHAG